LRCCDEEPAARQRLVRALAVRAGFFAAARFFFGAAAAFLVAAAARRPVFVAAARRVVLAAAVRRVVFVAAARDFVPFFAAGDFFAALAGLFMVHSPVDVGADRAALHHGAAEDLALFVEDLRGAELLAQNAGMRVHVCT